MRANLAAPIFCLASIGFPRFAFADSVEKCADASEQADRLVAEHKPVAAKKALEACLLPECPAAVRQYCTETSASVTKLVPSVIVAARDSRGGDLPAVKLLVDGQPASMGTSIELEPGWHVFRFEAEGFQPKEERINLRESERQRLVTVDLRAAKAAIVRRPSPAPTPKPARETRVSAWAYVFTGLAIVAGGTGIVLGVKGQNQFDGCKNQGCTRSEWDDVDRLRILTWVSVGVAASSAGVGTYLFLSPTASDETSKNWTGFQLRAAAAF